VLGVPEIVSGDATLIENAGNEALDVPSLTLMTMPEYVPAWVAAGEPLSAPLEALKLAQDGAF
jgi:hypothetical protein